MSKTIASTSTNTNPVFNALDQQDVHEYANEHTNNNGTHKVKVERDSNDVITATCLTCID